MCIPCQPPPRKKIFVPGPRRNRPSPGSHEVINNPAQVTVNCNNLHGFLPSGGEKKAPRGMHSLNRLKRGQKPILSSKSPPDAGALAARTGVVATVFSALLLNESHLRLKTPTYANVIDKLLTTPPGSARGATDTIYPAKAAKANPPRRNFREKFFGNFCRGT